MQCLNCGGAFEWAGNGQHARCTRCLSLFSNQNGQLSPIVVEAPGGGFNPEFNNVFAQNLGFGPPPPGAQPMPPPQQQPQHNLGQGTFDMGGGHQLQVKINGQKPADYVKNEAKSAILWWAIGAGVILLLVCGGAGLAGYIYYAAKSAPNPVAEKNTALSKWDGKSTLECSGGDVITITNVKANVSGTAIKTSGACQLTLMNVDITAPIGIEASAGSKVTMTGGSINATTNTVVGSGAAQVTLVGTKVTGKSKKSGGAKITGAD